MCMCIYLNLSHTISGSDLCTKKVASCKFKSDLYSLYSLLSTMHSPRFQIANGSMLSSIATYTTNYLTFVSLFWLLFINNRLNTRKLLQRKNLPWNLMIVTCVFGKKMNLCVTFSSGIILQEDAAVSSTFRIQDMLMFLKSSFQ